MFDELRIPILKNLRALEHKLETIQNDDDIRIAYNYATKIKNGILSLHQESSFGIPQEISAATLIDCTGYVDKNGIAVLSICETLPHNKEITGALTSHWQSCIHAAIANLAQKISVPKFDKAMVGIHIAMPRGANNIRIWDTSNRSIDLILNNLKGVFFPDDNIEHMAFSVVGSWSGEPKTTIYIGDFASQSEQIMAYLTQTLRV